jgi:hypothetical protein
VEVSHVRNRLRQTLDAAKARGLRRRQEVAAAEAAFTAFLDTAAPLARQLAAALKAEGYPFTVFTPERGVRLAPDRGQAEFIDLSLDTSADPPQVMARISYTRGSRRIDDERPLKPGATPDAITEDEILDFLLQALAPWLSR